LARIVEQEVEVSAVGEFEVGRIEVRIARINEISRQQPALNQNANLVDWEDRCEASEDGAVCVPWVLVVQDVRDDGAKTVAGEDDAIELSTNGDLQFVITSVSDDIVDDLDVNRVLDIKNWVGALGFTVAKAVDAQGRITSVRGVDDLFQRKRGQLSMKLKMKKPRGGLEVDSGQIKMLRVQAKRAQKDLPSCSNQRNTRRTSKPWYRLH
jgi:hypothetical protein